MNENANGYQEPAEPTVRLEQVNSQLRKALERVRVEVLSRYIPLEIQEEIRKALDG
jgi:hypothetical protein